MKAILADRRALCGIDLIILGVIQLTSGRCLRLVIISGWYWNGRDFKESGEFLNLLNCKDLAFHDSHNELHDKFHGVRFMERFALVSIDPGKQDLQRRICHVE